MKTSKIKSDLIAAIQNAEDPLVLLELSRLLDIALPDDQIIKLSAQQKSDLKLAISQIDNGQSLPHAQAKEESEEWLKD